MEGLKQYTLDTNVLRYKINRDDGNDLRNAARIFWRKVENQIKHNEAVLLIPQEVIRELEVQSFTLKNHKIKGY
ncbi:hypothetical protein ACUL41_13915 [Virgibacillus natechei]|uniref:hypothetical protein n=1 Tax=Virgibacillus sp. CBA3643 TaxID=2942278 RepID=UPI0035A26B2A